jgi:hypothetical protein
MKMMSAISCIWRKWQWATFAPTESINDPVVLLGVLFRMEKLEGKYTFSSDEFTQELRSLSDDLQDSIGVNLAGRGGERNVMRNSQQYWKSLNLIPKNTHGLIELTDYGRKVARHEVSQTEFSAITIMTHQLPNVNIQSEAVCEQWKKAGILIKPLQLILSITRETEYLTVKELRTIVIPLSGTNEAKLQDYVNFIGWYRSGELDVSQWPNCCEESNDKRMAREFLLFLANYGYLLVGEGSNDEAPYRLNYQITDEIAAILSDTVTNPTIDEALRLLNASDVISDVERKRVQSVRSRPHQAQFRKAVLAACERCVITNVTMPEVLEAAHIKPYKYHGEDTIANGFAMRLDIHMLFDTGHLRISPDGVVDLSGRARMDYGALIPPRIVIPDFINRGFLKWRWDNYNGM